MHATIGRRLTLGAATVVVAAGPFALTPPATAGPCGARDLIVRELADTYKQRRLAMGLMTTGELLEIFGSPGGVWTAVVSAPSGRGCIVASGEAWTPFPVGPEVEAEAAVVSRW